MHFNEIKPGLFYSGTVPEFYPEQLYIFDIDHTIIKPKQHRKFPINKNDFIWLNNQVPVKLNKIKHPVFISNQKRLKNQPFILERILLSLKQLKNPDLEIFIASEDNLFRKPNIGIFEQFIFPKLKPKTKIYYIGDAAGRKKDFSDTDRKFSYNIHLFLAFKNADISIQFLTPEEFFLDKPMIARSWSGFNPENYLKLMKNKKFDLKYLKLIEEIEQNSQPTNYFLIGPNYSGKTWLLNVIIKIYQKTNRQIQADYHPENLQDQNSKIIKNPDPEIFPVKSGIVNNWIIFLESFPEIKDNISLYQHMGEYCYRLSQKKPEFDFEKFYQIYNKKTILKLQNNSDKFYNLPLYLIFKNRKELYYFLMWP